MDAAANAAGTKPRPTRVPPADRGARGLAVASSLLLLVAVMMAGAWAYTHVLRFGRTVIVSPGVTGRVNLADGVWAQRMSRGTTDQVVLRTPGGWTIVGTSARMNHFWPAAMRGEFWKPVQFGALPGSRGAGVRMSYWHGFILFDLKDAAIARPATQSRSMGTR